MVDESNVVVVVNNICLAQVRLHANLLGIGGLNARRSIDERVVRSWGGVV